MGDDVALKSEEEKAENDTTKTQPKENAKEISKVQSSENSIDSTGDTPDIKEELNGDDLAVKCKKEGNEEGNETPNDQEDGSETDDKSKKPFDSENDDDDDDDDGIQVTIGDIKNQAFEPQKFKAPYQRQGSQSQLPSQGGSATKPNLKGVDLDSVGSINGVPIFDYDLDSIKLEDKPWRKPGADIMDYFNYGFTEESWTKYCEKQRRLRLENNCKVGLILGNGDFSDEISKEDADIYLGQPNRRMGGMSNVPHRGGMLKSQGVIDVIGSSSRDSRRPLKVPQRGDFTPDMLIANSAGITHLQPMHPGHMHLQQSPSNQLPGVGQSSNAAVLPISMNMPPPPLNIPPPDFALPPPTAINHSMAPPPHNMMGSQAILVAPPNPYGVPSMQGQFDPFYRQPIMGGMIQASANQQKDRRGIPGVPFRFDNPYSAPPPFQPPPGMPPAHWGGMMPGAPPPQAPPRSPKKVKNNSDISSSEDEARPKENSERQYSESRHPPSTTARSSRDRSRVREYDRGRDRNRREYDSSRSRHYHASRHYGYRDSNRNHRKRDRSPRDSSYDGRHGDRKRRSSSSSDSESDYEETRSKK